MYKDVIRMVMMNCDKDVLDRAAMLDSGLHSSNVGNCAAAFAFAYFAQLLILIYCCKTNI